MFIQGILFLRVLYQIIIKSIIQMLPLQVFQIIYPCVESPSKPIDTNVYAYVCQDVAPENVHVHEIKHLFTASEYTFVTEHF